MTDTQQKLSDEFESDAARFRKASEPHESPEVGEKTMKEFRREVGELRLKYQVRDILMSYDFGVIEKDGTETVMSSTIGLGSQMMFLPMAACLYGIEKDAHDRLIRKLVACSGSE